jgi:hypothetical protein
MELNLAMAVLVERETEDYKLRYKLPAAGYLQRRGPDGRYVAVKAEGQWDVAFPLRDYGAQIAGNDVDMAYMRIEDLDRHLMTVVSQNVATVRFLVLQRLLNNLQQTFNDDDWGDLLIEPIANGDTVLYPPLPGTDAEATENHFLTSGYIVTAIADAHNPIITLRDEILEHVGDSPNGTNIAVFITPTQETYVKALTGYVPVSDNAITLGDDTARLTSAVGRPHPGVLVGRVNGCWIIKWRWIPANYMFAVDLDQPPPLIKRVDPADTGLPRNLALVAENEEFPFKGSFWRHRLGLGCGNRLNAAVMFFDAGSTYTIPTGYTF